MPHVYRKTGNQLTTPFERVYPEELADVSDRGTAPAGCPIATHCFLVDKFEFVICNGKDKWYLRNGNFVNAGDPWSKLFA